MTYCKVGDLAITVNAYNPENIGKIVKIIGVVGLVEWYGFDSKTWVWEIETEGAPHGAGVRALHCDEALCTIMMTEHCTTHHDP